MPSPKYKSAPMVVTGVGKRIGLALAQSLLAQNIPVIGTYRRETPSLALLRDAGAELYPVDFYEQSTLAAFLSGVQQHHRALRGIIHNASDWLADDCGLPPHELMQRMMQIHVAAPYQISQTLLPLLMTGANAGRDIIHMTDYIAARGSKKHAAYAASKAALANLSLSLAAKYAPSIKVNSIAPALILFNTEDAEDYRQRALAKAAIPREGGVAEIIAAVDYLLSSDYVTGRTLHVDGGRHLK